ncbi:MAG: hypothetical protein EXS18_06340 [Verrucomicrobiae bacterium]|nr:hypothetical protein [Verrucomicrobiae bacterium]
MASSNIPPSKISSPTHVVSVSKQFTVFADDQGLAAGLASFADKVKGRLLNKLSMRDEWRAPVVVVVHTQTNQVARTGASIESSVYQFERRLKYQIFSTVPPPIDPEQFVRELVRVLCAEIANRDTPPSSVQLAEAPLWFTEGLTQNMLGDLRDIEVDLVERAMKAPQGAGLKTFVNAEQSPPKGIERELFKTKCKLFVRCLLALPDGMRRSQRFLRSLKPGVSWSDAFDASYRDAMSNSISPDDWWTSQLKQRSAPSARNRYTAQETDAKLTALFTMEAIHRDPKSGREVVRKVSWMELRNYLDEPGTQEMIEDRMGQLGNLQQVGHQSYAPVIGLYIEAFNHVRLDRFRRLGPTLKQADEALQRVRAQTRQITESLDKFEAQQMNRDLLFLYRDYFQTFDEIKAIEKTRDNSIKDYLDKFQANEKETKPLQ